MKDWQAGDKKLSRRIDKIDESNVTSVNTRTGAVVIDASDVGLENVDNTSDANKPVSTATQTALDLKRDLSDETLAAIEKIVNDNVVVDVFIYDTSQDNDPTWVDKANWQSYCLEPLNTAIRGATKKPPKLQLLVLEANTLTIHDATKADCPMWLVNSGKYASSATSVKAKNGIIYIGTNLNTTKPEFDFINDTIFTRYSFSTANGISPENIAQRQTYSNGAGDTNIIVDWTVNDIAITEDAYGNNITYVATDGGLSRIAPDGSVSNWTDDGNTVNEVSSVSIFNGYAYYAVDNSDAGKRMLAQSVNVPLVDSRYFDVEYNHFASDPAVVWASNVVNVSYGGISSFYNKIAKNTIGNNRGLTKLYPNPDNWGNSMFANITKDWNSGIMHGDIRGAWLANTDDTDLVGTELVINGDFETALGAEWVSNDTGILSIDTGRLKVENGVATAGDGYQVVPTVIGQMYTLSLILQRGTGNARLLLGVSVSDTSYALLIESSTSGVSHSVTFIATTTTTYITLSTESIAIEIYSFYDNVSVRLADADRSYKNNALAVHGTIARTPVATGAELVWYSGFSAAYLEQQNNPDLNFGVGSFYACGWFNEKSTVTTDYIFDRYNGGSESRFAVYISSDLTITLTTFSGGLVTNYTSTLKYIINTPTFFMVKRKSTGDCIITLNGVSETITGIVRDVTSIASLKVGVSNTYGNAFDGELALLRIGAGEPTPEQTSIIYKEEKRLFNENAKCTLQGNSSNVKAVDHDETTDILTACAGDTVTKFNGLVVTESRTETVTAISTVNGKELTNA